MITPASIGVEDLPRSNGVGELGTRLGVPDEVAGSCPAIAALDRRYLSGGTRGNFFGCFDDLLRYPSCTVSLPEITPDRVAAIMYTSGTTAHPKGVVHSHETLIQTAQVLRQMQLDERQVVLVMSSMAHLMGLMLLTSGLLNGATTVITRPFDFSSSLDAFERWGCSFTLALHTLRFFVGD